MSSSGTELVSWSFGNKVNLEEQDFPQEISKTLNLLGKKWIMPVLYALRNQNLGFSDLKKIIGKGKISSNMLSRVLTELQQHHLIEKQVVSISPIRVIYSRIFYVDDLYQLCDILIAFGSKYLNNRINRVRPKQPLFYILLR